MAMTLRLTDEEMEKLREQAEFERRSMHEVVRLAVRDRIERSEHRRRVRAAISRVVEEDREILDALRET
jgi:predicted transcriptional regulator